MGTLFDYLDWRGDLSLDKDPLNDVDALIFSMLSYLPWKDFNVEIMTRRGIQLKQASEQFFLKSDAESGKRSKNKISANTSFDVELLNLFRKAAVCPRFENVRITRYQEKIDYIADEQFAAVTFTLPNLKREKVVTFRGTDNSLIGWKEDFELAYMEQIPAQESARKYLGDSIGLFSGRVTVCGHSKGGNLAIYAASHIHSFSRGKITRIINFDGPGFNFLVVNRDPFTHIENKLTNYIPEESMVGMLLESIGPRIVVASSSRGIFQHNALFWQIERSEFKVNQLSDISILLDNALKTWLSKISLSERKIFINALFELLGASEGKTIDPKETIMDLKNMLKKYSKLDEKTKALLSEIFLSITEQTKNALSNTLKEKLPII